MNSQTSPETPLQKESRLFQEWSARLGNTLLNKVFDLAPESASLRRTWLVILFLACGFLFALVYYPAGLWAKYLQDIFLYIFNAAYRITYVGDPFIAFVSFLLTVFSDPKLLRFLPLFLAPFFIALQSAAIFLADVFNLEQVSVARGHVNEIALTGSDDKIRISGGDISDEHRSSSNYLIGGPGKVIVDLDSVAIFEKPDGTPHVIGPTGKLPGGSATIAGFERYRESIDIRDHYIELRDQDDKSPAVKGRTKDGIPISATDVHLVFSILRQNHKQKPGEDFPYTFSEKAMETIVYRASSKVTPDAANPSTYHFSWIDNMVGAIRGELGAFISQNDLTEFLANTGLPEAEKAAALEDSIQRLASKLVPSDEETPTPINQTSLPKFTPRREITNLFQKFSQEFTSGDRGVELQWIGIGTWKSPVDIVLDKHLQAWKLSRDNKSKGDDEAMKEYENETASQKMVSVIQLVPIDAYKKIMNKDKDKEKEKEKETTKPPAGKTDELKQEVKLVAKLEEVFGPKKEPPPAPPPHQEAIRKLLLEYRNLLQDTEKFIVSKNQIVPSILEEAIKYMDDVLGLKHWIRPSS